MSHLYSSHPQLLEANSPHRIMIQGPDNIFKKNSKSVYSLQMEYFLSSALIEKWRRMYAALQNTPFLTKMWDSEEQNNWPLSQKNFLGISFFSPKLPPIHEKWNIFLLFSWLLFCMLLFSKLEWWQSIYCTWGTCSFPKGGFNRTPCISLSMSFYCVWMCMDYAGWFYYLKEIGFPSVLWGKNAFLCLTSFP